METALVGVVILILAIASAVYLAWPFLRKDWMEEDELRMRHDQLVWEKNIFLQSLKELEMDYRMHKLSEGDYQAHRASLLAQAAEQIAQIEAVAKEAAERQIELDVARVRLERRQKAPPS